MTYRAAHIQAEVKVEAFDDVSEATATTGFAPRRVVTLNLRESFVDDADLDKAIDSFAATIREAARR